MAGVTGRRVNLAFSKYATGSWNVAASVTKGAYFESDEGIVHRPDIVEDRAFGQDFIGQTERGNTQAVQTTLTQQSRYNDYSYILEAIAMGSPAAVAISTSATGQVTSWLHVTDLAPDTDGLGVTVASDLVLFVKELTSAAIVGFTEEFGATESVGRESFTLLGTDATMISSVNINSTVAGASYPALNNRILKKQATFRLNRQSAGSLVAADAVGKTESFRFEFTRPKDSAHELGSATIMDPGDNEFPMPRLVVGFGRMNTVTANSLRAALPAGTVFKGDLTALGAYINSTDQHTKLYQYPHLEVIDYVDTVAGATQVKPQVTFGVYKPAAAPTGMAGIVKPFRLTRIMTNSLMAFSA